MNNKYIVPALLLVTIAGVAFLIYQKATSLKKVTVINNNKPVDPKTSGVNIGAGVVPFVKTMPGRVGTR